MGVGRGVGLRERAAVTDHNNSCSTNIFNLENHYGNRYITTVNQILAL